jgi:hypothetical protein
MTSEPIEYDDPIEEAIDLGGELVCLDAAINGLVMGYTNRVYSRADAYDGEFLEALHARREGIRTRLFEMNGGEVAEAHDV